MGKMMNMSAASSSPGSGNGNKLDRKTVERNRRIHMKGLCLRLTSLVPPHYFNPSRVLSLFPLISALHNTSMHVYQNFSLVIREYYGLRTTDRLRIIPMFGYNNTSTAHVLNYFFSFFTCHIIYA